MQIGATECSFDVTLPRTREKAICGREAGARREHDLIPISLGSFSLAVLLPSGLHAHAKKIIFSNTRFSARNIYSCLVDSIVSTKFRYSLKSRLSSCQMKYQGACWRNYFLRLTVFHFPTKRKLLLNRNNEPRPAWSFFFTFRSNLLLRDFVNVEFKIFRLSYNPQPRGLSLQKKEKTNSDQLRKKRISSGKI